MKIKLIAIVVALIAVSTFAMARIQEHQNHGSSPMDMPMMQNCPMHMGVAFSATYEEVPDGVRITLKAQDPAKLEALRTKVKEHIEAMNKGGHSMMHK